MCSVHGNAATCIHFITCTITLCEGCVPAQWACYRVIMQSPYSVIVGLMYSLQQVSSPICLFTSIERNKLCPLYSYAYFGNATVVVVYMEAQWRRKRVEFSSGVCKWVSGVLAIFSHLILLGRLTIQWRN